MYREIWEPEIETLTQDELYEGIEKEKLLKQVDYALRNSEFYRRKLYGFKNADGVVRDFGSVPFTEKKEIIDDQLRFPPFGSNLSVKNDQIRRIHRTSGTTGRPVFLALTQNDVDATIRSGVRCFWASGLRPDDMVFHCLNYCMWMGGFTDHQSLEKTGATVVPYGVGNSKNLIESILYMKPTAIHCTGSYVAKLELLLEEEFGISPKELGLKKGLFAGEGGIQAPRNRKRIEEKWGIKAMDANYGVSDILSMFGGECSYQEGLHFMGQGNLYVELIDSSSHKKLPIEKGVSGEFVLTNIEREGQPLIRYRTHDVVEIADHNKCECGRTSFKFKVLGRSDDMIIVKGINVYPSAIGMVISEFNEHITGEFQVVVEDKQGVDEIKVRIESNDDMNEDVIPNVQFDIKKRIKEKMDIKSEVELVSKGNLPRTGGKTKRLIRV